MRKSEKQEALPNLRFPEFLNEAPWSCRNFYSLLDDVLDFRGRTPPKIGMTWGGGNIISLSANNVKNGYINFNAECNLGSDELYEKWMGKVNLKKGDIVFTMEAPLGNALLIPDSNKYILSQRVVALKTNNEVLNEFLIQLIWSSEFQNELKKLSTGSTAKGINQKTFSKVDVVLPESIREQQKIADCLSSIDELICAEAKKLDALKIHKKGLMQSLFPAEGETVPKLRFAEFRDAGEWNQDVFDTFIHVVDGDRGVNYPKAEEFSGSGFCLFLNAKNVTKNGFRFEELQFITKEKDDALRKGKLHREDVVLTTRGSVGQFAYFTEDVPYENMRINSGMVILRVKSKKLISDYLFAFSKSARLVTHIGNIAFGNAQQQLTVAGIKKIPICYPKPEEQQKIADCLSSIDELISANAKKLDALKIHKKGLMQQLFPSLDEVPQ